MTRCPRCSEPAASHFTRGARRVFPHRCPHGLPCRLSEPSCDACAAARLFAATVAIQVTLKRAGGFEADPFEFERWRGV